MAGGERSVRQDLPQRLSIDELHRDVVDRAFLTYIVNSNNVGVIERRGGAGLLFEAPQTISIRGQIFRKYLDRDVSPELGVACPIDFAHATGSDGVEDFVRTELRAGGDGHVSLFG